MRNWGGSRMMMGRQGYSIRPAVPDDVPEVTLLIHEAFSIWKSLNLSLGPMFQTEAQTEAHLLHGKGYVLENENKEKVGTFSVEDGVLSKTPTKEIRFIQGSSAPMLFSPIGQVDEIPPETFLVFRRLAVRPDLAKSGLGTYLYSASEELALSRHCPGVALETAREAHWLFDWYLRLGFQVVGRCRYPGRPLDTILMIKIFKK